MSSVSVIIPCYNYASFLPACIESVLTQDVDVAVLVIDDCSTDDTPTVGATLAADPRVTFRRHERNIRHIATYNEGLDWADGDYTLLLSADDLLTPGALARAVALMDEHPSVGMVYGRVLWFESHDKLPASRDGAGRPLVYRGDDWIERRCRKGNSTIASPEVVVRTSCYKELGGYRPDLPHTADLEMWLRIAAHHDIAYVRDVDQAFYRVHRESMSRTSFASPLADIRERKVCFDALFEHESNFVPDAPNLRHRTDRALAREALWAACRAFDREGDSESVAELEAFAYATYPGAARLPESLSLRVRRRLGDRWRRYAQYALPDGYIHRIRRELANRRTRMTGV